MSSGDSDRSAPKSGKHDEAQGEAKEETGSEGQGRAQARHNALSSVGSALGGFARRVSALVGEIGETVSETVTTVTIPEAVRTALAQARQQRAQDQSAEAIVTLHGALAERPEDLSLQTSLAMSWARALLFEGRNGVDDPERRMGASRESAPVGIELLRAVLAVLHGEPSQAIDPLRKARRLVDKVVTQDRDELRVLLHFTAALVHRGLAQRDRAVRELQKSRARLRGRPGAALCDRMIRLGASLYLAQDRPFEAETWILEFAPFLEGSAPPPSAEAGGGPRASNTSTHVGADPSTSQHAAAGSPSTRGVSVGSERFRVQHIEPASLAPIARSYLAIAAGIRGDAERSAVLLSGLDSDGEWAWAHARVALVEQRGLVAARHALVALSGRSDDAATLRLWALCELASRHERGGLTIPRATTEGRAVSGPGPTAPELAPRFVTEVISALLMYADRCASEEHDLALQELAFVALALGCYVPGRIHDPALELKLEQRLLGGLAGLNASRSPDGDLESGPTRQASTPRGNPPHTASQIGDGRATESALTSERVLFSIRHGQERGASIDARWLSVDGDELALPDVFEHEVAAGDLGVDELSPLRNPARRATLLAAHAHAALSIHALHHGRTRLATINAVRALTEDPRVDGARAVLEQLTPRPADSRLESLLGLTTQLLSSLPDEILGQSFDAPKEALAAVILARERLARPFSIAVMGEFSSGKSSVVNALLGEVIAPMGVLPTTTTINLYRRGPGGGARVHYRDGRLSLLAAPDVATFLHGLDDVEASRVRYVEIERSASFVGDTTIVDTPGLNALDPYHEQVAREFLSEADAILWVFSATRGSTASESDILSELRADGRRVLGVLNKVDTLRGDEVGELTTYVREQLGDALLDVVPVSAKLALAHRAAQSTTGPEVGASPLGTRSQVDSADPFAGLERVIGTSLVANGRDIKRELTTRRVRESLASLRGKVLERIASLERAGTSSRESGREHELERALARVAKRTGELVVEAAEPLLREWLSAGVFDAAQGVMLAAVDAAEIAYLDALVEDICLDALALACTSDSLNISARLIMSRVVERSMVVWARGYFVALRDVGLTKRWLALLAHRSVKSEAGLLAALGELLGGVAAHWETQIRSLQREVLSYEARAARARDDAPIAEAMRLRVIVLGGLDAIAMRLAQSVKVEQEADPKRSNRSQAPAPLDGEDP